MTQDNIGRKFEEDFAKEIDGKRVPGSGNKWHSKLDVISKGILWSLKATSNKSFSITEDMLIEAEKAVEGMGGIGRGYMPGLGVRTSKGDYILLRLSDFKSILDKDVDISVKETRKEAQKKRGKIPRLLRGD